MIERLFGLEWVLSAYESFPGDLDSYKYDKIYTLSLHFPSPSLTSLEGCQTHLHKLNS